MRFPLPWKAEPSSLLKKKLWRVACAEGHTVAVTDKSTAHQIVRAVNCHEGLVDAMKRHRCLQDDDLRKALAACESGEEKKEPTDGR